MPVTQHNLLKSGTLVSIVLKADQRTGREVQGTVSQLLTRHNHPRGIKVRLTDGRIGRVQQIIKQGQQSRYHTMSQNNPWATEESQGSPYQSNNPNNPFNQHPDQPTSQQHPSEQQQGYAPQQQQPQQGGAASGYYSSNPDQTSYQQPPAPAQGLRRNDTESLLASQPDRGEQFERMQQFEATAPQSEDDKNQAQLQKEYPNLDSSLIAAIYHERKPDMGEVRELLQELNQS